MRDDQLKFGASVGCLCNGKLQCSLRVQLRSSLGQSRNALRPKWVKLLMLGLTFFAARGVVSTTRRTIAAALHPPS